MIKDELRIKVHNSKFLSLLYRPIFEARFGLKEIEANKELKKWDSCKLSNIIKVAFIVQMPQIWDKQCKVFEKMLTDERFDPYLVVVPTYDVVNEKIGNYSFEKDYFLEKYEKERVILAYSEEGKLYSFEENKYDYVFYQRPYEAYLPEAYHTKNIIKYSRTAYIPYFFPELKPMYTYYKTSFFRYLYIFFSSCQDEKKWCKSLSHRKNVYAGYPSLEKVCVSNTCNKEIQVLWTPRWVDDKRTGGSSFIKYKDKFVEWKKKHKNIKLVMRPHPLTFMNAIREKKMSEKDVEEYKRKLLENNIVLDDNPNIIDTIRDTDILITDESSINLLFFLTGRPMIYCANHKINFTKTYKMIMNTVYIENNWEKVQKRLEKLFEGEDTTKNERLEVIDRINITKNSSQKILNIISKM